MRCPVCDVEVDKNDDICPVCHVALSYEGAKAGDKRAGAEKGGVGTTIVFTLVAIVAVALFCWAILSWHQSQRPTTKVIAPGVSLSRIIAATD
ncbi:MAG: hypothetical protein ACOX4F_06960 [Atopobiaceae bacterium]